MQCPHCEYVYEHSWHDGAEEVIGDDSFFSNKKGDFFRREKWGRGMATIDKLDIYGCPKCMKVFMG